MPRVGETFEGFQLLEELGRGSFARVYLAKQQGLAGRAVALKVSLKPTREAERLARLQHSHIVPIYSVHSAAGVQLICMPFLGRRTIADLLQAYRRSQSQQGISTRLGLPTRRGSTSVAGSGSNSASRRVFGPSSETRPATIPADGSESRLVGDVEAVLSVLAQLADGLTHAHSRGILHLDLKPANILLADTGEPMILDFNLSFDAVESNREIVGGTIPYMAPEQLADLRSRGRGGLDNRTDLYSLGVTAYEMLAGTAPFPSTQRSLADYDELIVARRKGPQPLADRNRDVSPAVESIVRKLLAADPADRYQSASDLREDIDRQRTNKPLRFAADRSPRERVRKWRKRNPGILMLVALLTLATVAFGTASAAYSRSRAHAVLEAVDLARSTREGLDSTRLDLVLPGQPAARECGRERALETLGKYGLPADSDWQHRPAFQRIPDAERSKTAADLGELLLLLAHARWAGEAGKPEPDRAAIEEARAFNHLAERCFAEMPPPFLASQRQELAASIGQRVEPSPIVRAASARDHFLDALIPIERGQYQVASTALEQAIATTPNHAAAQFCLAYCRHQRGQYERAVERYEVARVLMPQDPRPFSFVGMAYFQKGNYAQAEASFDAAIEIDSDCGEIYWKRAMTRYQAGKHRGAEEDLSRALAKKASPIRVYLLRAAVRGVLKDERGAAADLKEASNLRPVDETDYLVRGTSRISSDTSGAIEDFRAAARINPGSLAGLQNQAHILAQYKGDNTAALELVSRAAEYHPESVSALAGKAILLARLSRREEAHKVVQRVLELPTEPKNIYQLGCVFALTSATDPEDSQRAFTLLRRAFRDGYRDVGSFATDPDLAPIRQFPEFVALARAMKNLDE